MPKISSYTTATPALTDKLIGSDANGNPTNETKNFTVQGVRDTILPETTTETPALTDKVFGSNDSGNPRTANRNFTVQGVRDAILPETTTQIPTLTDRVFGANPSEQFSSLLFLQTGTQVEAEQTLTCVLVCRNWEFQYKHLDINTQQQLT